MAPGPGRGRVHWHVEGPDGVCGSPQPAGRGRTRWGSVGPGAGGCLKIRLNQTFRPNPSGAASSLASPQGPRAQTGLAGPLHYVGGEKQSWGDSEGDARPRRGLLGTGTLGLSHPLPFSLPSSRGRCTWSNLAFGLFGGGGGEGTGRGEARGEGGLGAWELGVGGQRSLLPGRAQGEIRVAADV